MMPKYTLKDGVWVATDQHSDKVQPNPHFQPLSYGEYGRAPAGFVHTKSIKDRFRKFDKPSETEIKRAISEDEAIKQKNVSFQDAFAEAKKDLESGKLRLNPNIFNDKNKTIAPFGNITDKNGVTYVVPIEVAQREKDQSPEEYFKDQSQKVINSQRNEIRETVQVMPPSDGPNITGQSVGQAMKSLEDTAISAAKKGLAKGRTFG